MRGASYGSPAKQLYFKRLHFNRLGNHHISYSFMKNIIAIVLAAGKGTRMKSDVPKVLHNILGRPVIGYVLDSLAESGVDNVITVVGHEAGLLKEYLGKRKFVIQKKLLGSADAVLAAAGYIRRHKGDILITYGDVPLVGPDTIGKLVRLHRISGAGMTLLTVRMDDPSGYGRVLRDADGRVRKIAEETEASLSEKDIKEINIGTCCCKASDLMEALSQIRRDNSKKEYFLTDVVEVLIKNGKRVEAMATDDRDIAIGINTRKHLADAALGMRKKILEKFMCSGVTIEDPETTIIYPSVEIGRDTIIRPNTIIESDVIIGGNCRVGPFARIRPGVRLGRNVEIGNFVELVRTTIADNTLVKHHSYLGDADVGRGVNIGAGTITANYDGKNKNKTVIGDGAFLGVGTILIAPVRIGKKSVTGAGAVIPKGHNVPDRATVVGIPAKILIRR